MSLSRQIVRTLAMYIFVLVILVLIVFFPRERIPVDYAVMELPDGSKATVITEYKYYSLEMHWSSIKYYFNQVVENKSLGQTRYNASVETELALAIKMSLMIIVTALLLSFVFGILKGIFDLKMARRKLSIFGNWSTWIFQSIPDFFIILVVQYLLIRKFPIINFFEREAWYSFMLPALLASIMPTLYIARITSGALASQVGQQYIQVARAKGLTERVILYKHILRNCIGTILSHLTALMVFVLSNLLFVEVFMNYPGAMNRLMVAIDYSPYVAHNPKFEHGVIFGICLFFMLLMFIVQIVGLISKRYFLPKLGEV